MTLSKTFFWSVGFALATTVLAAQGAGPGMGARMFTTARQMEIWAHGQAIYDLLDTERPRSDRLRSIAVIGVRTFGWTFASQTGRNAQIRISFSI